MGVILTAAAITETIQGAVDTNLVNIVLAIISLLATYAFYGITKLTEKAKAQTAHIKDESARSKLVAAISDLHLLATITVGAIEQTTAAALRKAVKAGAADRTELEALAHKAKVDITAAVTPEVRRIITENLGSFDDYVEKLVEERVREAKLYARD